MANSDNVLRCGLTTKHMDVQELLAVVRFDRAPAAVVEPVAVAARDALVYPTPAEEFRLERRDILAGTTSKQSCARGPELLLVTNREARATVCHASSAHRVRLSGGGACLIPDGVGYTIAAETTTSYVKVTVPYG